MLAWVLSWGKPCICTILLVLSTDRQTSLCVSGITDSEISCWRQHFNVGWDTYSPVHQFFKERWYERFETGGGVSGKLVPNTQPLASGCIGLRSQCPKCPRDPRVSGIYVCCGCDLLPKCGWTLKPWIIAQVCSGRGSTHQLSFCTGQSTLQGKEVLGHWEEMGKAELITGSGYIGWSWRDLLMPWASRTLLSSCWSFFLFWFVFFFGLFVFFFRSLSV